MFQAIVTLESATPYSQSRPHDEPKKDRETGNDYELRTWRNRLHTDKDDMVFIPAQAFKNCLSEAAKYLGRQVPGKGKNTYTKHFEAGIMVIDNAPLGIQGADVAGERLYLNSDGRRGGNKRVWRTMPCIPQWKTEVTFIILDEIITEEVFTDHLCWAGRIIGIGRWRPRNNGNYGRFAVKKVKWSAMG